jgi:hypothetical protein
MILLARVLWWSSGLDNRPDIAPSPPRSDNRGFHIIIIIIEILPDLPSGTRNIAFCKNNPILSKKKPEQIRISSP